MSLRLDRVRAAFTEHELDGILISSDENRRYLSGFTGSAGYLLISPDQAILATDFRYVEQAGNQAPDYRIERIAGGSDWLPRVASELGVSRLGFESQDLTVHSHSAFDKAIDESENTGGLTLVETSDLVDGLRATKYPEEMDLLSRAIEITDQALEEVSEAVEPGVTEREIAWELEKAMRERGAEALAFDTIVAAGPNGALPHHSPSERAIGKGEPVVIDMGAKYQGYCADLSRTILVGEPDETFRRVYGTVLRAQLVAEEQVRSGMTGAEADAIARDVIAEAGYGDNFGHSLGHGVGLAVHELPWVSPRADELLEDGMMFTIEPGIYLSDWGGVRIEDVVVLENGRARVLSKARKLDLGG
jgi:Xaa-Pro aminopeptidase